MSVRVRRAPPEVTEWFATALLSTALLSTALLATEQGFHPCARTTSEARMVATLETMRDTGG